DEASRGVALIIKARRSVKRQRAHGMPPTGVPRRVAARPFPRSGDSELVLITRTTPERGVPCPRGLEKVPALTWKKKCKKILSKEVFSLKGRQPGPYTPLKAFSFAKCRVCRAGEKNAKKRDSPCNPPDHAPILL